MEEMPKQHVISKNPKYPPSRTRGMGPLIKKGEVKNPNGRPVEAVKYFKRQIRKALLARNVEGETVIKELTDNLIDRLLDEKKSTTSELIKGYELLRDSTDGRPDSANGLNAVGLNLNGQPLQAGVILCPIVVPVAQTREPAETGSYTIEEGKQIEAGKVSGKTHVSAGTHRPGPGSTHENDRGEEER